MYNAYLENGYEGLARRQNKRCGDWNKINEADRDTVVEMAVEKPELSSRELAWEITDKHNYYISESSVYRIFKENGLITTISFRVMSASDSFTNKTTAVNQMWQTDFTYFKIYGCVWYYLSTILDDYSRYIVTWKLCANMKVEDVTNTLDKALAKANLKHSNPPKLLSDNRSCYISHELVAYIKEKDVKHVRGRPLHPQTQDKIERYHRSMKNVVKLYNYFSPGQLKQKLEEFVHYYNNERYHESINNLVPADVYIGQADRKLKRRIMI